jgi:hypothetical protein
MTKAGRTNSQEGCALVTASQEAESEPPRVA